VRPAASYADGVKLERKHALVLLAVAVWNVVTYAQFTKALITTEEDRPAGYFVAHGVLIVVNVVIAVVLGRWGLRALRATRSTPVPVER
jgi:hypothetical protein